MKPLNNTPTKYGANKIITIILLTAIIMVSMTPLLSTQEANAAKGLKVLVDVDSAGCKYADDSGTLSFVFGAGEVQVGEEFEHVLVAVVLPE